QRFYRTLGQERWGCVVCLWGVLNAPLQNLIFRYLQNRSRIQVWLYEQVNMRLEGCIIGFDEYRNLVPDDAEEIRSKPKSRKELGRIMLKGDNITLLQSVSN
ncbi:PREDICTED: small nuclear ribonucleoprotein E, partial [Haliaeetus leucocephalus]|uniref:small nuclear ribonucleoprotein E n=1 Tax=Haliaeetus leucocephalus TaxID=52644 RepID=UPI00053CD22F